MYILESGTGDLGAEGLAEDDDSLSGAHDAALEHDEVLLDDTVVRKASHGSDGLLGEVEFSGSVVVHLATFMRIIRIRTG